MITAQDRAIQEQQAASDPGVSAFVEASAGSGKTKLLTDRILRLMLAGAPPGRIQCLTFTKAAAAEMALRLQAKLAEWATIEDRKLDAELRQLDVSRSAKTRGRARELFAEVLDLPGGMRIGTIHAFAQSLLRRFPLEAAISPHFRLVEDTDARTTMQAAREGVLGGKAPEEAIDLLAGMVKEDELAGLVDALDRARDRLSEMPANFAAAIRRAAGATAASEAEVLDAAVSWPEEARVLAALRQAQSHGSLAVQDHTAAMLDWLARSPAVRAAHWADWHCALIKDDNEPRTQKLFLKAITGQFPDYEPTIRAEQARVLAVAEARKAAGLAGATVALMQVAQPALGEYQRRKGELGYLDYSDLIGRTMRLLEDPGAAWVLYKLDGGIDHLLLDEVQDTAPDQWKIAHRLTEEFFAGLGARSDPGLPARTFFAVGDPKQSIYSFQGADPAEFVRSRDMMAARVKDAGQEWRSVALDVSFRSTRPVLALIDAVFAEGGAAAAGVVTPGKRLQHFAKRANDAGRVELWPLTPIADKAPSAPWTIPERNLTEPSGPQRLAEAIATWIKAELRRAPPVPSREGRPLEAGDILILVQRRTQIPHLIVRALKGHGIAVAGLDQLVLTEQIAVQDVLAACDAVLLPDDDLSVACVLTSPLGGLDDGSLMALALGRRETLWEALRTRAGERPDWAAAWAFLGALQARADHVTPHALLAEALGPLGGRARLLARLGEEAAEPLDELLGAALAYTALHAPSLQGFVHWLRRSGAMVKREASGAGRAVRVMTAHGAKGLQAPLVILPDTTALPIDDHALIWSEDPATGKPVPLWAPAKEYWCRAFLDARAGFKQRAMEEYNRLLYVALTRAEDRLVVCGWETKGLSADSWYAKVAQGFRALDAVAAPFAGEWGGERRIVEQAPSRASQLALTFVKDETVPLPAWAGRPGDWRPAPPPAEPALPVPLAPSRPDGATLGPVPPARSPLAGAGRVAGKQRGTLVHELLQHLPALDPARWERAARAYLGANGLEAAEVEALVGQTLAVLREAALAPLFGPESRAEQSLTGLANGVAITGKVDRMVVLPDVVLLADYKTGRAAPADAGSTPVLYLRQMAAYRAVVQALYPGRTVRCQLIWTEGATVVELPSTLLDAHGPRA